MWKRLAKYRTSPRLAPPTLHADKDGSYYRPPLESNERNKRVPNVPQRARIKSAKRMVAEIEARRVTKMSDAVKANPLCYVAAIIERPPIIMRAFKSWELDMAVVQSKRDEEVEAAIPPSIIKPTFEENPPWAVDMFKEVFREKSNELLPFVSPPRAADSSGKSTATTGSSTIGSATEDGSKKKKEKPAKGKKGVAVPTAAAAAPTPVASETEASIPIDQKNVSSTSTAPTNTGWRKSLADLGIELEENKADDSSAYRMHVELKTKQSDKQTLFQPAPRVTEADQKNDRKSLDRKLAEKLYLVVKRNGRWGFPNVKRTAQEGLMSAAQRAAWSVLDQRTRESDLYFISACPMGYRAASDAKEFFLRAQLIHGDFNGTQCPQDVEDFAWLSPSEIVELLIGTNGDADEIVYLQRMFADDWWQDKLDSDELSPVEDALAKRLVREIPVETQIARFEEEEKRRQVIKEKLATTNTTSSARI